MKTCETKADIRDMVRGWRREGARIGLVPTMGYLHEGHLSLVRAARADCDRVVVSIFVNPTQFGPLEDLDTYPRDSDRDLALLRDAGVDAVFLPTPDEMYAPGAQTIVETTALSSILVGALRPGHFRGVATVVTKLLNIVGPDAAYFGRKDYQQLAVIRTMVRDLDMDVHIVGVPTERAADGLALSSRNVRLTEAHRAAAPALYRALTEGAARLPDGVAAARAHVEAVIAATEGAELKSIDIRDADTLAEVPDRPTAPVVLLLAVRFGDVLLIDNLVAGTGDAA